MHGMTGKSSNPHFSIPQSRVHPLVMHTPLTASLLPQSTHADSHINVSQRVQPMGYRPTCKACLWFTASHTTVHKTWLASARGRAVMNHVQGQARCSDCAVCG